jgi:hypothetical protein
MIKNNSAKNFFSCAAAPYALCCRKYFREESMMQLCKGFISKGIILAFAGLLLSGIMLVDGVQAGPSSPLKVTLGLPSSVNLGQSFNISIAVTNYTGTPVTINKVAVGYGLEILRFRGPYEVAINPVTVQAYQSANITAPFKVSSGAGTVVGMVVILAHDEYTGANLTNNVWYGVVGSAACGVKVN